MFRWENCTIKSNNEQLQKVKIMMLNSCWSFLESLQKFQNATSQREVAWEWLQK